MNYTGVDKLKEYLEAITLKHFPNKSIENLYNTYVRSVFEDGYEMEGEEPVDQVHQLFTLAWAQLARENPMDYFKACRNEEFHMVTNNIIGCYLNKNEFIPAN
jgi:hypothetical protein